MRGIFLLSLLMGIALLSYLWATHTAGVSHSNTKMREEMAPVTGRGPDGGDITTSAELEGVPAGLNVNNVKKGSYFDQFFGLQTGDVIVTAGDVNLAGVDENSATAFLYEAAQGRRAIVVKRGSQKVTLQAK